MEKSTLKVLRAKADLTQGEVANGVGVNRSTYGKWENYESFPNAVQLIKLSMVFKCPLDAFYFPIETS